VRSLSRSLRRRLERRGDRALAGVAAVIVDDPTRSIAIVREDRGSASGHDVLIVDAELGAMVLARMGLSAAFEEIATERVLRPGTLPTVVIVGGWASIAFVKVQLLSPGGDA